MRERYFSNTIDLPSKSSTKRGGRVAALIIAGGLGFSAGRFTAPSQDNTSPVNKGPKNEQIDIGNPNVVPTLDPRTLATTPGSLTEAETNRIGALRNEAIKVLAEEHKMSLSKGLNHKSGLSVKFISDGNILTDEFSQQIAKAQSSEIATLKPVERPQTELDKAIEGYTRHLKQLPDSPMKQKLLDAIARAEAGRLSGNEIHVVIPSSNTTYWQPPEMQMPSSIDVEYIRKVAQSAISPIPESISAESIELTRKQSGIIFEDIGVSIVAINSASPNGTTNRIFGGKLFTNITAREAVLTETLHEYAHRLFASIGISRNLDAGEQEKLLEEADRRYLEERLSNPSVSPKVFNI